VTDLEQKGRQPMERSGFSESRKKIIGRFLYAVFPFLGWIVFFFPVLSGDSRVGHVNGLSAVLYFFLGQLGFYLLVKRLFREESVAYCASLIFLFSSVSLATAARYQSFLHFVPGVWFFFFLLAFGQTREKKYFLGLLFSGMVIMPTAQALYFLTAFLIFVFFFVVLFPREMKNFFSQTRVFVKRKKILSILCLMIFFAALINEIRVHNPGGGPAIPPVSYEMITDDGLSARMRFEEFFVRLGDIQYGNEGMLYISVAAFLILLLGAGLPLHRRTVLWTAVATMLLFLTLTKVTPVHRFFVKHFYYFRKMQHFYFFNPYVIMAAVLMVAEPLSVLLTQDIAGQTKWARALKLSGVLLIHAGFLFFLRIFEESIIFSTWVAIGLSAIYWGRRVFYPGLWRDGQWLLVLAILIQPAEVFWHYKEKAMESQISQTITARGPVALASPDTEGDRR